MRHILDPQRIKQPEHKVVRRSDYARCILDLQMAPILSQGRALPVA
jgi:hypothetical protein